MATRTALEELRQDWRETCTMDNGASYCAICGAIVADDRRNPASLTAAYRWIGNPAEVNSETLLPAIEEVAATYPADEWQNVTWQGQRLIMADLLTTDDSAEEVARRVMVSYRQGEDFGRLARYVAALDAMRYAPVGTVAATLVATVPEVAR